MPALLLQRTHISVIFHDLSVYHSKEKGILIIFQNILFSYSHHDKYEFYLYSILLYNKKQENYYIGGIADYVDKKSQSDSYNLLYGMGNFLYL